MADFVIYRRGAHPRNQPEDRRALGVVQAPNFSDARRIAESRFSIALYPNQWIELDLRRGVSPAEWNLAVREDKKPVVPATDYRDPEEFM
jgi:hypothetical protein